MIEIGKLALEAYIRPLSDHAPLLLNNRSSQCAIAGCDRPGLTRRLTSNRCEQLRTAIEIRYGRGRRTVGVSAHVLVSVSADVFIGIPAGGMLSAKEAASRWSQALISSTSPSRLKPDRGRQSVEVDCGGLLNSMRCRMRNYMIQSATSCSPDQLLLRLFSTFLAASKL